MGVQNIADGWEYYVARAEIEYRNGNFGMALQDEIEASSCVRLAITTPVMLIVLAGARRWWPWPWCRAPAAVRNPPAPPDHPVLDGRIKQRRDVGPYDPLSKLDVLALPLCPARRVYRHPDCKDRKRNPITVIATMARPISA